MIVTEEEAKTKRCQESFGDTNLGSGYMEARPAAGAGYGVGVSVAMSTSPLNCIGSACMAWRWLDQTTFTNKMREPNSHGYCGKAGRP